MRLIKHELNVKIVLKSKLILIIVKKMDLALKIR
jgi:hypothetical protein